MERVVYQIYKLLFDTWGLRFCKKMLGHTSFGHLFNLAQPAKNDHLV